MCDFCKVLYAEADWDRHMSGCKGENTLGQKGEKEKVVEFWGYLWVYLAFWGIAKH